MLAPLAALCATTWVLGWRLQVISTASMAPLYPAGTLVAVEPIDASAVEAGMVIVFRDPVRPDRLVAHRAVTRIPADQPLWQTKGDANQDADPRHVAAVLVGGPLALLAGAEVSDLAVDGNRRGVPPDRADPPRLSCVTTCELARRTGAGKPSPTSDFELHP